MSKKHNIQSVVAALAEQDAGGRQTIWAVIISIIAVSGIGCLVAFNLYIRSQDDPYTQCTKSSPVASYAILLDLTDPLTPLQHKSIKSKLRKDILMLQEGTRVTFGVVSTNPNESGKHFKQCKPQSPENASSLYQNPALIDARFRERFLEPMDQKLEDLLEQESAPSSPIMESIQSLVVDAFHDLSDDTAKQIVIVSDLLQHSDVFSFYKGHSWKDLQNSPHYVRMGSNLTGVEVSIIQLPRPSHSGLQNTNMYNFWSRYFNEQGAISVKREVLGDL